MQGTHLGASGAQPRLDLQQATRVGGDDNLRTGPEDVLDLALLEAGSHRRFGQVITAGTAATDVGFGEFHIVSAGHGTHELTRWLSDLLRMSQVTSIMGGAQGVGGGNRSRRRYWMFGQPLGQILNLTAERN